MPSAQRWLPRLNRLQLPAAELTCPAGEYPVPAFRGFSAAYSAAAAALAQWTNRMEVGREAL